MSDVSPVGVSRRVGRPTLPPSPTTRIRGGEKRTLAHACDIELEQVPEGKASAELFDIWAFTISGLSNKTLGARNVFKNAISSSCWTSERPAKRFTDDAA